MSFRTCFWTLLALGHLGVVLCGACDFLPDCSQGPAAQLVQWYGTMSGARSQYGFYAPEVGARYRPRFILQDDHEFTWCDSFAETASPEAQLRLEGTVEAAFANGAPEESPASRQRLIKSWAAVMFNRHPSASSLTVVIEVYDIPFMAEFRAGSRPSWRAVYEAQLRRDSTKIAAGLSPKASPAQAKGL